MALIVVRHVPFPAAAFDCQYVTCSDFQISFLDFKPSRWRRPNLIPVRCDVEAFKLDVEALNLDVGNLNLAACNCGFLENSWCEWARHTAKRPGGDCRETAEDGGQDARAVICVVLGRWLRPLGL